MVEVFSIEIADDNDDVTLGNSVARLSSPQLILTKLIENQIKTNDKQLVSLVFMLVDLVLLKAFLAPFAMLLSKIKSPWRRRLKSRYKIDDFLFE